jgi:hypothetical protein
MTEGNGRAPLTKEALADRSRFQFRSEELELPELDGFVVLKALSVEERDNLPDLTDDAGNPDVSIGKLAAIFAAAVDQPKLTAEEAEEFLGSWPASALDRVIEKFGEIAGNETERSAAAREFPGE